MFACRSKLVLIANLSHLQNVAAIAKQNEVLQKQKDMIDKRRQLVQSLPEMYGQVMRIFVDEMESAVQVPVNKVKN